MIVRHFLSWVRSAPAGERAEATRALARAWLISDLSEDDRIAAEGALLTMLDDRSAAVRKAMSDIFASSSDAPPAIIRALATDLPAIALPILEYSPLLADTDLVDLVATGTSDAQEAIARRLDLSPAVAAAIAEVGGVMPCFVLLDRADIEIPVFSLDRVAHRHGHHAVFRETLLARDDLSAATRLVLVDKLSETLAQFVTFNGWIGAGRTEEIASDARERSRVELAQQMRADQLSDLIGHLRRSGELTPGLVLRALLCADVRFFEASLVELSGLSQHRVSSLVADRGGVGLTALLERAGFPRSVFVAIRSALDALRETGLLGLNDNVVRLRRPVVERVLMACEAPSSAVTTSLLALLRRFATEAAREEARLFCEDLVSRQDEAIVEETGRENDDVVVAHEAAGEAFETIAEIPANILMQDDALEGDSWSEEEVYLEDGNFAESSDIETTPLMQDGFETVEHDWMVTEDVHQPETVDNDDFMLDLRLTIKDRLAA